MRNSNIEQGKVSPDIRGKLFTKVRKNSRRAAEKPQPKTANTIADLEHLHEDVLYAFSNHVDTVFPNANFLGQEDGSHIQPGTKLSLVLRTRYDPLTKMNLPKDIRENYRKTVRNFLEKLRLATTGQKTYSQLNNAIGVYQTLSEAIAAVEKVSVEMERLLKITPKKLTPNTIDRRLSEYTEENLITPNKMLISRLERSTENAEVSDELKFAVKNLVGATNLLDPQTSKSTSRSSTSATSSTRQSATSSTWESAVELDETQFEHAAPPAPS